MHDARRKSQRPRPVDQQGQAAIILLLLIIGVGATILVYILASPAKLAIERDRKTAEALAQAKAALIGYAVGIRLDVAGSPRIGDLPCPDLINDGTAGGSCSNAGGTTLGRLPWRTLGLPDLRDGAGERLWYAVSENFKNNPAAGTLNSDTRGTITVRNRNNIVINDATNTIPTTSGVIAVIIAPGTVLKRDGEASSQDRSNVNNPGSYLDVGNGEDNAVFSDGTSNGFINGDVFDAAGNVIVNDRILTITYQDLMPLMQRRVAKEVLNCLNLYAGLPQNGGPTNGRYPWAVPPTNYPLYTDQQGVRFGRVPSSGGFNATFLGISGFIPNLVCNTLGLTGLCMTTDWPSGCNLNTGSWWTHWRELVFYGVAEAYQPAGPLSSVFGVPVSTGCGSCLSVDTTNGLRVVVVVAGNMLSSQVRSSNANKRVVSNYLEDTNVNGDDSNTYTQLPVSTSFNDFLLFQ